MSFVESCPNDRLSADWKSSICPRSPDDATAASSFRIAPLVASCPGRMSTPSSAARRAIAAMSGSMNGVISGLAALRGAWVSRPSFAPCATSWTNESGLIGSCTAAAVAPAILALPSRAPTLTTFAPALSPASVVPGISGMRRPAARSAPTPPIARGIVPAAFSTFEAIGRRSRTPPVAREFPSRGFPGDKPGHGVSRDGELAQRGMIPIPPVPLRRGHVRPAECRLAAARIFGSWPATTPFTMFVTPSQVDPHHHGMPGEFPSASGCPESTASSAPYGPGGAAESTESSAP